MSLWSGCVCVCAVRNEPGTHTPRWPLQLLQQELRDVCQHMDYMVNVLQQQEDAVRRLQRQIIELEDDKYASARRIAELRQEMLAERQSADVVIRSLQVRPHAVPR